MGKRIEQMKKDFIQTLKKTYDEQTRSERVLTNCLLGLKFGTLTRFNVSRYLSAAEAVLYIENYFEQGYELTPAKIEKSFLGIKYTETEPMAFYIKRCIEDFLTQRGIL